MKNRSHSYYIVFMMWGIGILLVAFFLILAIHRWFCSFEFSNVVAPLDVISLLVTSFVAIFLGYYITKKMTESRAEKDFLIEDLRRIESYMYTVQGILRQYDKINLQQITGELEAAALGINRFRYFLRVLGKEMIISQLVQTFYKLYTVSTDFEGESAEIEDVSSGIILYHSDQVLIEVRRLIHMINTQ